MGAISPVPFADATFLKKVEEQIVIPTINGLVKENINYRGFIFIGLMNCNGEPKVIEYNCRMGDPETEVVMPRLQTDLVLLLQQVAEGRLKDASVSTDPRFAVTVMAVSGGYPGDYQKGFPIEGLAAPVNAHIFHAGTKQQGDHVVTHGGRVLAVTSFGNLPSEAVQNSLLALERIRFSNMYFRRDIGYEFA
jgi:phosphoribosylamine--glycine ligase